MIRRRGWIALTLALLAPFSGCCLTRQTWSWANDDPAELVAAWADHERWYARVRYEGGDERLFTDALPPHDRWHELEPEPADEVPAGARRLPVESWTRIREDDGQPGLYAGRGPLRVRLDAQYQASDREAFRITVGGDGLHGEGEVPAPADWTTWRPYAALLLTPFTLVVDALSAPVHLTWILASAGGHGRPWVPWCTR